MTTDESPLTPITCRIATPEHVDALAAVHVQACRELVPDAVLAGLDADKQAVTGAARL